MILKNGILSRHWDFYTKHKRLYFRHEIKEKIHDAYYFKETKPLSFIKSRTVVVTGDVIMAVESERIEQNCYFVNII